MAIWREGNNAVASDEGFRFGSASRDSFYYQEGKRKMIIFDDVEWLGPLRFDSWWIVIFPFLIRGKWHIFWSQVKGWEDPHAEDKIEPQKRDLILARIEASLKLMKLDYEIH